MRLLVVTQYFWPEDFRINELVGELVARGHAVTVLTGVPNYPAGRLFPEYRAKPEAFAEYRGARVMRVPMVTRGSGKARLVVNYLSFALSATISGIVRLRRERFDAIFVFEPSPVTVGLPAIALRALRGWPVVFWVLDQWPETLAAVGVVRSEFLLKLVGQLVSFIYDRCDLVLGQSKAMVELIAGYCREPGKAAWFPNWVEGAYGTAEASPAAELDNRPELFTVLFAGNIGQAQDFPAVLDAAERLKSRRDIRWVIVGDGRMAAWVAAEVRQRGLTDCVRLLGRYPAARMPDFFAHAQALLVSLRSAPAFALTVPGKLQTYLSSGVPVLGMLDGEGARTIRDAGAGFASRAGNAGALAANVERMAALSVGERSAMGERGRVYAAREFDRTVLISRLEGMLHVVAARAAVGAASSAGVGGGRPGPQE